LNSAYAFFKSSLGTGQIDAVGCKGHGFLRRSGALYAQEFMPPVGIAF
jgi:hypothetical protein